MGEEGSKGLSWKQAFEVPLSGRIHSGATLADRLVRPSAIIDVAV